MAPIVVAVGSIEDAIRHSLEAAAGAPPRLREAMAYSLLAPGKRLRPRLVVLACVAAGGDPIAGYSAAAAVEMVHTYSLIHDDLPAMDDDDLRRGRPTCHKAFDEATAILAGDALLTLAFQTLTDNYEPDIAAPCCRELAVGAGAAGMVGGQVLDLAWENRQDGGIDELQAVHAGKTGALFRACLRIGGHIARADEDAIDALDQYGQAFGLMFQITDDLLDVEGDTAAMGKRAGKDAGRGKLTYPGLLGVEASRARARELCRQAEFALKPFGNAARELIELAHQVGGRTH
ncbi:MAG: polyprenyl synthetase family protein [Gemmataceae bacterium]|nr:polyprenyl synthetase family protein [Gemmataceae bacterium]